MAITETQTLKYIEEDDNFFAKGSVYKGNKSGGTMMLFNKNIVSNA